MLCIPAHVRIPLQLCLRFVELAIVDSRMADAAIFLNQRIFHSDVVEKTWAASIANPSFKTHPSADAFGHGDSHPVDVGRVWLCSFSGGRRKNANATPRTTAFIAQLVQLPVQQDDVLEGRERIAKSISETTGRPVSTGSAGQAPGMDGLIALFVLFPAFPPPLVFMVFVLVCVWFHDGGKDHTSVAYSSVAKCPANIVRTLCMAHSLGSRAAILHGRFAACARPRYVGRTGADPCGLDLLRDLLRIRGNVFRSE